MRRPGLSLNTHDTTDALCLCRRRRLTQMSRRQIGPLMVSKVSDKVYSHDRSCSFYVPGSDSSTLSVRLCSKWILSRAVRLGFSLNFCSISSSLSFYNVVPSNAPAFELIDSVLHKKGLSIRSAETLIRELGMLYQSGKASTTDTTADGETLLHRVRLIVPLKRSAIQQLRGK